MSSISKILLGVVSFFCFVVLYALEINHFQNYFQFRSLMIISVITGMIIGLGLGLLLARRRTESIEQLQLTVACVILCAIAMPLLVSLSNRLLDFRQGQEEQVTLVKSEPYAGSRFGIPKGLDIKPDGYRIFIIRNKEVKRLQQKENPFPGKEEGALVTIPIKNGLWGFEFVDW